MKKEDLFADRVRFSEYETQYEKTLEINFNTSKGFDVDSFFAYLFIVLNCGAGELITDKMNCQVTFRADSLEKLGEYISCFYDALNGFCQNITFKPENFNAKGLCNIGDSEVSRNLIGDSLELLALLAESSFRGGGFHGGIEEKRFSNSEIQNIFLKEIPKSVVFFQHGDCEDYAIFYNTYDDLLTIFDFPSDIKDEGIEINPYGEILELPGVAWGDIHKIRLKDLSLLFNLSKEDFAEKEDEIISPGLIES